MLSCINQIFPNFITLKNNRLTVYLQATNLIPQLNTRINNPLAKRNSKVLRKKLKQAFPDIYNIIWLNQITRTNSKYL